MADYRKLVPYILKWEGGFVNDPADAGGATNKGVTLATYTAYRKAKGLGAATVADLWRMTEVEWTDIFKTLYWYRWQGDRILSQSVASILVDWVWGSGKWGIIIPQRILGVAQDGIVGNVTLTALNARPARELFNQIKAARVKYIDDICRARPLNERFRKGWMNRLNDLKFEG